MRAKAIIEYTRRTITKVVLAKGKAFQIEPGKNYLIVFDNDSIAKDDVAYLGELMRKEFNAKSIGVVLKKDINNMKVVEVPES